MVHLIFIIIPFLIVDIINPILLGGTIYTLSSKNLFRNSMIMLLSFLVTYFFAGLIIAYGMESFENYFHLPAYFDYGLELIVAALLFYMAAKQSRERDAHPEEKLIHKFEMTTKDALQLGFQINIVGLAFAVPYLGAIDQILKADASILITLLVLLIYNILYVLPYASLILIRLIRPKESSQIFKVINEWMHCLVVKWMPLIFVVLGLILIEDAISFLIGYREYSFLELL
jgi:hypothetical protein